ncbi:mRNA 3'-end-processing protein RNA14 [Intoshia linei]|uniref:mRNA 3'-end-processing protein RNA14 n=1 Tax=Intoshia linei TaxID=1819745 RepID=A0A177B8L1_9BILA|nr:mRNA 3'-end-processing protein RNA14 [Intoshia linei]
MSNSQILSLKDRAKLRVEKQQYDSDAWGVLICETTDFEEKRKLFETIVEIFPKSAKFWKEYIEMEIDQKNYDIVDKLFERSLLNLLHIDLWKLYLDYIKDTKANIVSVAQKFAENYDFVLGHMGLDFNVQSVYVDYIKFLRNIQAVGNYAENQQIVAVRRIYRKACVVPMYGIDSIWRDYCAFENGVNPLIGRKMQDDLSKEYNNAKRVAKEYENFSGKINRNLEAIPIKISNDLKNQLKYWTKYIDWEKSNPLMTQDRNVVIKRVTFAYEQCLLCMNQSVHIWLKFAQYLQESSDMLLSIGDQVGASKLSKDAMNVYERAFKSHVKNEPIMNKKYDNVVKIFQKLIDNENTDPTLAYIQYMRFSKRVDGIKSARKIFKIAREDSRSKYQIYIAAAMMEYYCTKDKSVTLKIMELGMKKHPDVIELQKIILIFICHLNEDNNTRVMFERIISNQSNASNDKAGDMISIWNNFLDFELTVGDLSAIKNINRRRVSYINQINKRDEIQYLNERYGFYDLKPFSQDYKEWLHLDSNNESFILSSNFKDNVPSVSTNVAHDSSRMNLHNDENMVLPDCSQMLPFKPVIPPDYENTYPIIGGTYPPPPIANELIKRMPAPTNYKGPFVNIDKIMNQLSTVDVEKEAEKSGFIKESYKNGKNINDRLYPFIDEDTIPSENYYSGKNINEFISMSKNLVAGMDFIDKIQQPEPEMIEEVPVKTEFENDIYRSRQINKKILKDVIK